MIKIVGLLAEYNPFHRGHAYQLAEVRRRLAPDCIVILMSGNVVQRGEFAIIDKWERAKSAIEHGADLVLELPLVATLQSADYFAQWGMKLLASVGVNQIVFGTESATEEQLNQMVEWLLFNEERIETDVLQRINQGNSYARSYQETLEQLDAPRAFDWNQPNHILALQYVRTIISHELPVQYTAIQRLQHDEGRPVLSATQIRQQLMNQSYNDPTFIDYTQYQAVQMQDYYPLLRYQIASQTPERLETLFDIKNGLGKHIYEMNQAARTFSELLELLVSPRWTRASIQRKLLTILLNITKEEWAQSIQLLQDSPTLRILALNDQGRQFVRDRGGASSVQLVSNVTRENFHQFILNHRADQIYQQKGPTYTYQNNERHYPIIMSHN